MVYPTLAGVAALRAGVDLLFWALHPPPSRPLRRGILAVYFLFIDLSLPVPAGASAETGRDSKEIKSW
jgi:hypothetical protein